MDTAPLYHQWFGIPPKDQPPNAYRLLGVELFEADPVVIEAAAEQRMLLLRARQYGPQGAQAQRLMNEVSQAQRTLLDEATRREYDAGLRQSLSPEQASDSYEPLPSSKTSSDGLPKRRLDDEKQVLTVPIRTTGSPLRSRKRPNLYPVLLWSGIVGGSLLAIISVVAGLVNSGQTVQTVATAAQQGPTRDTPSTKALPASRRPTIAAKPTLAESASPQGEFQFQPQELPEEPQELPEEIAEVSKLEDLGGAGIDPQSAETSLPPPTRSVDESDTKAHATTAAAIQEPQPEPAVKERFAANPVNEGKKRVLQPEDFEFIGAFKLPQKACGQSTGYAAGCLALRHMNKRPQLFCDSHVGTGGAVYEVEVPGLAKAAPYPTAEIVQEWGDIYQGRKQKANGESYPLDGEVPTTGLRWDEADQKLWWTYGQKYNTENQDAPTFGATRFKGNEIVAEGPWKLSLPQSWQRGGTLEIPEWFADKYTDGRRLGVGFGGYYSIFEGGSYGPTLSAVSQPVEGKSPTFVTLLAYPIKNKCVRDANYQHVAKSWMGDDPVGDRGTWNATDEIGGEIYSAGAIWIDTPDKHGLLFFASLGTGRLAYEEGGVQAAGREDALYIYDPVDLAKVAQQKAKPWSVAPKFHAWKNPAPGMTGRAAGVAYDPASRRFYVVFVNAYVEGEEAYPVVAVYQI